VSIWLHVSSGSLNETDATQGLAHYLSTGLQRRANFRGHPSSPSSSRSGSPSGAIRTLHELDQTTYQLALPAAGRSREGDVVHGPTWLCA